MILALNIGNSNITFGGYTPDGKLVFSSRLLRTRRCTKS